MATYVVVEVNGWLDYEDDEQTEVETCDVESVSVADYKQEYAACYMLVSEHCRQETTMLLGYCTLEYELWYTLGYDVALCILG